MVDGVRGHVSHVVKHVVVEKCSVLEAVTTLHLTVKENRVLTQAKSRKHATHNVVLVRL